MFRMSSPLGTSALPRTICLVESLVLQYFCHVIVSEVYFRSEQVM